jgi:hypothetical protein
MSEQTEPLAGLIGQVHVDPPAGADGGGPTWVELGVDRGRQASDFNHEPNGHRPRKTAVGLVKLRCRPTQDAEPILLTFQQQATFYF